MTRIVALLLAVVTLAACRVERDADVTAPAPDVTGDTSAAAPAPTGAAEPGMYIARGACPFECCVYREWTLETSAVVRSAPASEAAELFTVTPGDVVTADSGNVYVLTPGIVVADQPFAVSEAPGAPTLAPGDTLYVLDTMGEGYVHTRFRGVVYETSGQLWNWGQEPTEHTTTPLMARMLSEHRAQWWVHVSVAGGRAGWVMMDDVDVAGADACA